MAYEENLTSISVPVNSDLSAAQYHFVVVGSDEALDLVGTAGAKAIGVLQNNPNGATNATVGTVAISGVTKVKASAAIAAGANVASTNAGEAVTATTGNTVLGIALTAAAGDGSIFSMQLMQSVEPA